MLILGCVANILLPYKTIDARIISENEPRHGRLSRLAISAVGIRSKNITRNRVKKVAQSTVGDIRTYHSQYVSTGV